MPGAYSTPSFWLLQIFIACDSADGTAAVAGARVRHRSRLFAILVLLHLRHRVEQPLRVRMQWLADNSFPSAVFAGVAGVHHRDAVADSATRPKIVGDEQHR